MSQHSSSLSPTQRLVLQAVAKHTQLTSSQIRRLFYSGTPDGCRVRSQRHLARLVRLGLLRRVWTVYDTRNAEYLYMMPGTTTRGAVMHTLDLSEIYVGLRERLGPDFIFDREPYSHVQVGRVVLKPDAYIEIEGRRAYLECDRGTERKPQLAKQMRQYVRVFLHEWDGDKFGDFPQVLFTVPDSDRKRIVQSVIYSQEVQDLFHVVLFSEAVEAMGK